MNYKMVNTLLIISQVLLFLPAFSEAGNWQKRLEKDEIVIYTRHSEDSKYNEIKAVAKMHGTLQQFRHIITDIDAYPSWMPDCKATTILEAPNDNDLTYLMKIKSPFPFSNRDVVQHIQIQQTHQQLKIRLSGMPDKVKKNKKYIRMRIARGSWTVTQITPDTLSIQFIYLADPGGDIPAWLVNSFVVKNPHLTLLHVRQKMSE